MSVAGQLARPRQRGVEPVDEDEAGARVGLVLAWGRWVTTTSGPGKGLVPPQVPAASYIVRPTTAAPRPAVPSRRTRGRRLHAVGVVTVVLVGPRPAHDPVVQVLAAAAQALAGAVVRPHHTPVDRRSGRCDDLSHVVLLVRSCLVVRPGPPHQLIADAARREPVED